MLAPLLRFIAITFTIATLVILTGLPDFTALERAVSKAFDAADARTDTAEEAKEAPLVVFISSPIVVDSVPVLPPAPPLLPVARMQIDRRPLNRPFGARPGDGVLLPLYSSFVTLQVFDVHSTLRALDRGGVEANPVMAPFTGRPAAFIALKAGSTAGILYLTERVRRRSPTAAIVMMAAFNSAYATVVANNYRLGNRLR